MSDTNLTSWKRRLTTIEATVQPGERAQLTTVVSENDFLIESMMTGDNGLHYVSLRAETLKADAPKLGVWGRFVKWWTGGEPAKPIRLIYDAEAPSEDTDAEPGGPQEFEDFMLSLIRGGTTFDASPDGTVAAVDADEQDEEDRVQLPIVRAGERLLLDVLNPTSEPITAKVTFSGPEFHEEADDQ